jgi:hypothetical protein
MKHFFIKVIPLTVVALVAVFVSSAHAQTESIKTINTEVMGEHAGIDEETQVSATPPKDLTAPEEPTEKDAVLELLEKRPINSPKIYNLFALWVQNAIEAGIPVNTILLILLLPVLALLVAFVRVVIGLPSLEMLVPIALTYVFVAVGVAAGSIILAAIILASFLSRMLLKRLSIMYYPKRSISMLLLALLVFFALTISSSLTVVNVQEISIFPILILTLLGDSIVTLQLRKSLYETTLITVVTIIIGLVGYWLATEPYVRNLIILYPEIILLTLPLNVILGRYFGLRISELFRFRSFNAYGTE